MRLPDDLPQQAKARIYRSKIEAERALEEGKKNLLPDPHGIGGRQEAIDTLVRTFFLHVLAQFTHEACQTSWSVERIDKEVTAFVETFLSDTVMEYTSPTFTFPNVISRLNGKVLPEIWEGFRASKTWRKYQDELEQVAAKQANDPEQGRLAVISRDWNYPVAGEQSPPLVQSQSAISQETPLRLRTVREPNLQLLEKGDTLNRKQAAEALGMSERTFDRHVVARRITPFGAGPRKRFKITELRRFLKHTKYGED